MKPLPDPRFADVNGPDGLLSSFEFSVLKRLERPGSHRARAAKGRLQTGPRGTKAAFA